MRHALLGWLVVLAMGCGPSMVSLRDWRSVHVQAASAAEGTFLPEDWDGEPWLDLEGMESDCTTEEGSGLECSGLRVPTRRRGSPRPWRQAPLLNPRPTPEQLQVQTRRVANLKVVLQAQQLYRQRLAEAQTRYPNSPGYQEHHLIPMYLGGARSGTIYRLPTAYHKAITQAFRERWKYGQRPPSPEELQELLIYVYARYPIPQLIGLTP